MKNIAPLVDGCALSRLHSLRSSLRALGIDPVQYFVLLELFSKLSDRQEFEAGNRKVSLGIAVGMYAVINAFINLLVGFIARAPIRSFVFFNLVFTTFLLVIVL